MSLEIHYDTTWIELNGTGDQGPAGLIPDNGEWTIGKRYLVDTMLLHDGSSWRAVSEHVATTETEPGVGEDWRDAWQLLAARAELTAEFITLRNQVEDDARSAADAAKAVALDLEAVNAAVGAFTQTATTATTAINTRADQATGEINGAIDAAELSIAQTATTATTAINQRTTEATDQLNVAIDGAEQSIAQTATAAKQALATAAEAASLSIGQAATAATTALNQGAELVSQDREAVEDLRELTRQDAVKTGQDAGKTAGDRIQVAADAAMAAAAVRPLYGVQIYRSVQVENGEYAAERYEPFGSTVSTIFIEMLNGTGSADVHMTVSGAIVAGPWTVTAAAPILVQNLLIAVPKGAKASFHTSAISGVVHEIWASAYGKYKA